METKKEKILSEDPDRKNRMNFMMEALTKKK